MNPNSRRKILPRSRLVQLARSIQSEGRTLVLTNGCFDILHAGHVRYLEQAAGLGDVLAVAVNEDESVRRLKGPGRPLNPAHDRAQVLAALECVQYVVLFPEDTAVELVREIRPDVYVKGGDYSPDPDDERFPVEGAAVRAYGGSVEIVDLVPGRSTTALLRRITENG